MENNITISAELFPSIPRSEIIDKSKRHFSLKELESLGGPFALAASALSGVSVEHAAVGGLYKCVFPEGVVGSLAKFKDGSGFTGTIMNEGGIAAQARWIPAGGSSVLFSLDPTLLMMGMAMMNVNQKLDHIQKTVGEILDFLKIDKESDIEGSVNSLSDILDQYKFNSDNDVWKSSKLTIATDIKVKAENNIIFYRKQIGKRIEESQNIIHSFMASKELKKELNRYFNYYRLCLYLYAQASFLEVLLGGNFKEEFLNHVSAKLNDYSLQYREDYSMVFDEFEKHLESNAERVIAGGLGKASRLLGETIGKIPLIKEGIVDEALISAGESIEDYSVIDSKKALKDFSCNSNSGIGLFLENIELINALCNQPLEIYFDHEEVYFIEGKKN